MFFGCFRTRMARVGTLSTVVLGAALLLLVSGTQVFAGGVVDNGYVVNITATADGLGTESWSIPLPLNWTFADEHTWQPGDCTVYCGSEPMFDVTGVFVRLKADPEVELVFNVKNRTSQTATFTVNSAVLGFTEPLVNNWAYATAGITLTDGGINGAALTGLQTGAKAYEAKFNGTSVFADLVPSFSVLPGQGTDTKNERYPAVDTVMIPGSVSSISSQFKFTLSPGDLASGTSSFVIGAIPEPATLGLLLVGSAILGAKRRRQ